jgi:subtilase family serine protease
MHTLFAILLAAQVGLAAVVHRPDIVVGTPDLVVTAVGLNADGNFAFTVTNRGAAITVPFKVDASLDGYLRQTLQFQATKDTTGGIWRLPVPTRLPFANGDERHFTLPDVKVDMCSSPHALKVVADSGGAIPERDETNNEKSWSGPTPCPDLTVKSISKHWQNGMHTEFNAEIVILNQGTGTARNFAVAAGASATFGIPSGEPVIYERLGPGETLTIHAGNAYVPDGISVHVVVDVGNLIKESNENNNVMDKRL